MTEKSQERIQAERKRLMERERTISKIRRSFARYGHEVVDIIIHYALQKNGLMNLLVKLTKNVYSGEEEQHRELIRFLQNHDPEEFLKRVRE